MRPIFLRADDIRELRRADPDYQKTERLKSDLTRLRAERRPFHLGAAELEPIFRWKLRGQYRRKVAERTRNTDVVFRAVTRAAFAAEDAGSDFEAKMRLRILDALPGVGIPVASAMLALSEPARYCVIDFRGWRAVFREDKRSFSVREYLEHRHAAAGFGRELGWPVQEVDFAIWNYDIANDERRWRRANRPCTPWDPIRCRLHSS